MLTGEGDHLRRDVEPNGAAAGRDPLGQLCGGTPGSAAEVDDPITGM